MRFFLLASALALFAAPVLSDSRPNGSNAQPVARVVKTEAIPRAAAAAKNVATRSGSDLHSHDARQLINLGFGATINVCVQVRADVNVLATSVGGAPVAIGTGSCICVETDAGLTVSSRNILGITGVTAPASVRVFVNGIQLNAATAVPIANTVLGSTCTTLLGANLLTFLLQTALGTAGTCGAVFQQQASLANALVGANICQTNSQTLTGVLLGQPVVSLANTIPIFNVAATDFNTRCCQRACNAGFVICGGQCVASGTTCVSGVPQVGRRKRRDGNGKVTCPRGLTACLVPGTRVYDCVDIQKDLESCGGCVDPETLNAPGAGSDCTALAGVNDVECIRGVCQVRTCNKGFAMSANGTSCDPVAVFSGLKLNNKAGPDTLSKRKVVRSVIQA